MKKILLFVAVLFTMQLFAHPASDVMIEFDPVENILSVSASHKVKDAEKHFIEEIVIKLNKEEIVTQKFFKQDDLMETTAVYKIIDAKAGDKIEVTTKCNKFGKKKNSLIVPALPTDE